MLSKITKQALIWGSVLILVGLLLLLNHFVELPPWAWAACLAGAGLAALALYLAERSDGLVLLSAYLLGFVAGLIALVPAGLLRDEAIACYVLLSIALPFLALFLRDRARAWALIPAYPLLFIVGLIGLAEWGHVGDDLLSAYLLFAIALPFFLIYARDRRRRWALIPGGFLAALGLSFATWLSWPSVRASLVAGDGVGLGLGTFAALALLAVGAWLLVRGFVVRRSIR
jgi:hypothetical protein